MVRLRSPAPLYGGIPERPKGADCKSVVTDFAGPNPASPTITRNRPLWSVFCYGGGNSTFGAGTCAKGTSAAGSHTPPEDRRASSSGVGCGYLRQRRIPSFSRKPTLEVGFLNSRYIIRSYIDLQMRMCYNVEKTNKGLIYVLTRLR